MSVLFSSRNHQKKKKRWKKNRGFDKAEVEHKRCHQLSSDAILAFANGHLVSFKCSDPLLAFCQFSSGPVSATKPFDRYHALCTSVEQTLT